MFSTPGGHNFLPLSQASGKEGLEAAAGCWSSALAGPNPAEPLPPTSFPLRSPARQCFQGGRARGGVAGPDARCAFRRVLSGNLLPISPWAHYIHSSPDGGLNVSCMRFPFMSRIVPSAGIGSTAKTRHVIEMPMLANGNVNACFGIGFVCAWKGTFAVCSETEQSDA